MGGLAGRSFADFKQHDYRQYCNEGGWRLQWPQSATLSLERILISGNKATSGQEVFNRSVSGAGTVVANDFNLVGASNNAGISGFSLGPTDVVPSVPMGSILAPLADNGGPTPTHALVPVARRWMPFPVRTRNVPGPTSVTFPDLRALAATSVPSKSSAAS